MSSRGPRFRRNGKLFACEPCRKQKVRCDHQLPACGRCTKRKAEHECNYHPAPLTRPGGSAIGASPINGTFGWATVPATPPTTAENHPTGSPTSENTLSFKPTPASISITTTNELPGFLGSISFSEVWRANEHISDKIWLEPLANVTKSIRSSSSLSLSEESINSGAAILDLLTDFQYATRAIQRLCEVSQITVPFWVISDVLRSVEDALLQHSTKSQRQVLARQIFEQTFLPIQVDENTNAENFHLAFSGPKLRWEIFGVLFTYIGISSLMCDDESGPALLARQKFTHNLTEASNLCVSFCKQPESLNDPLIWLLHSNSVLLTLQYGEANHCAWQRLGELASTVYAMGLHIDPSNDPKLPYFLGELRRGMFAAAYSTDKSLSTFLGRPPRISVRYSSCRPPFDLTDEELKASPDVLDRAIAALDSTGWNQKGLIYRQTYSRIKYMNSVIREEALELSLGPPAADPEQRQKAQDILERSRIMWGNIPKFARYDDTLWDSGIPSSQCFTLLYYYLGVTFSQFLLHRIIARHGGSSWEAMYQTAQQLLNTVLVISKRRNRVSGLSRDFAWVSIFYGLPSAALLSIELLRQQQLSDQHVSLPRAEIIRKVSVFISLLDWVAQPDDGNYELCQGAKNMLEKILDSMLENQPASTGSITQTAPADSVVWVDELFGGGWMNSGPFLDSLATADTSAFEVPVNWSLEA